jgi:iron complex transport system substrate-binding protein
MRAKLILIAVFAAILGGSFLAKALLEKPDEPAAPGDRPPERIVSMSPHITETLFALGLGDRVVGVTRFCTYPPEAQTRAQVGGYLDPNYEAILALKPDVVIYPGENDEFVHKLHELGLAALGVRHNSIEEILDTITTIGRRCGVEARADRLVAEMQRRIDRVARKTAGLSRPGVMIVVERSLGVGRPENVCIAGADRFMNRMVELAGGRNCCGEDRVGFPLVSLEGIHKMNPEVILDLVAERRQGNYSKEVLLRDWQPLGQVAAVRDDRVYLVDDEYVFIPGPRLALSVEKLARLIHPELKWEP